MKNKILVVFAVAVCGVAAGTAETVKARYVRLTVTASRPAPKEPPFYGGRSWQIRACPRSLRNTARRDRRYTTST